MKEKNLPLISWILLAIYGTGVLLVGLWTIYFNVGIIWILIIMGIAMGSILYLLKLHEHFKEQEKK